MYACGTDSPQKEPCLALLEKIKTEQVDGVSSAEVLQEILHRYWALGRIKDGMGVYNQFRSLPLRWLEILPEDVDEARLLLENNSRLSSRDALHIAVMRRHRITKIATYDKGFLGLPSVTVFLPEQV